MQYLHTNQALELVRTLINLFTEGENICPPSIFFTLTAICSGLVACLIAIIVIPIAINFVRQRDINRDILVSFRNGSFTLHKSQ